MSKRTQWVLELVDKITSPVSRVQRRVQELTNTYKKTETTFTQRNNKIARSFAPISAGLGGLVRLAGGVVGGFAAFEGIKGVVKLGADLESTRIKFETMLGSASKADTLIQDINKFANATPFQNQDLQKNAELLLNFGIAGDKVLPTLKMLGDVSGGNAERFGGLSLAFSQISSTGRLTGEDLNQMIERGFNPLKVIADKTGQSMASLKDKMSKGAISAEMVEQALRDATGPGGRFFGMMDKMSESFSGRLSTLVGEAKNLGMAIGTVLLPYAAAMIEQGLVFVEFLKTVPERWNAIKKTVEENSVVLKILLFGVSAIAIQYGVLQARTLAYMTISKSLLFYQKAMTAAQWLLNSALVANPIGLVIAGLAALVAGMVWAYRNVDWFREGVNNAWESIKNMVVSFTKFLWAISPFKPLYDVLTWLFPSLEDGINRFFDNIKEKFAWFGKLIEKVKGFFGFGDSKNTFKVDFSGGYGNLGDKSGGYANLGGTLKTAGAMPSVYESLLTPTGAAGQPAKGVGTASSGQGGMSIAGSGGSGRNITMNLDITNNFSVDGNTNIETLANKIFARVNDKLKDALISYS